ncbi:bifunctional aminoglycoside phosphotransferase/ATP-binding protein [Patulibacter sp. SYSU D01012]|uniref:bifunctional aminoglycoside phosphotransferase/ATP-binding protein n=1 Tax=Patulibacter sp. SYSU D01012 TaxID=2817381 RepID=UPI001B30A072|nr:bifunctional aminoglycoside phosphotransferase/ATP-binding protein [Patulibacter sp. SYSU D01012]
MTARPATAMAPPAGPSSLDDVAAAVAAAAGTPAEALERIDTHMSAVLLTADRAYKVGRARSFGFADHRTLAARRRACHAEIARNRVLAPDLYLGVRGVARTADGPRLTAGDDPDAFEVVVEMRRFAAADTLAAHAQRGPLPDPELEAVAERVARYHRGARRVAAAEDVPGACAHVLRLLDDDADELAALLDAADDRAALHRVQRRLRAYVRDHGELLAERAAGGWIRALHGDLRAEHVLLGEDGVRVVDALAFADDLREVDVADELAFLAMDLETCGAGEAAPRLLGAYRRHGGDPGPATLRALYAAHRACVRAKVAALRGDVDGPDRAAEVARGRLALAERHAWRTHGPRAYVLAGPSGSGKSLLADRLARRTGIPVLSSDVLRKAAAGLAPTEHAPDALYAPAVTAATYAELGRRAAARLEEGESVVVDATSLTRAHRRALAAAMPGEAHRTIHVVCDAPAPVLRRRVAARAAAPGSASDATLPVLEAQLRAREPLDEVPAARVVPLRTDAPVEAVLDRLAAALDA